MGLECTAARETTLRERVEILEKENAELRENIQHTDNTVEIVQRHIRELDLQIYGPQADNYVVKEERR